MYAGWDPILEEVLQLVQPERLLKWTLADLPTLERWVSKSGRVALIGDAAHAMVQYLAQGAAQAIEDAATIAEAVGRCKNVEDLPKAMAAYQIIRKPRCERIQKGSVENGDVWHMPDGPEQEARDAQMGKEMREALEGAEKAAKGEKEKNPNMWSDEEFQPWMFGHDAIRTAEERLDELLGAAKARL